MPGLRLDGLPPLVKFGDCSTVMHIGAIKLPVASFGEYLSEVMFVFCRGRGAGGSHGGYGGGKSVFRMKN